MFPVKQLHLTGVTNPPGRHEASGTLRNDVPPAQNLVPHDPSIRAGEISSDSGTAQPQNLVSAVNGCGDAGGIALVDRRCSPQASEAKQTESCVPREAHSGDFDASALRAQRCGGRRFP